MDFITKIIGLTVGLAVGTLMVTQILLPTIDGLTFTGENADTYETMIGVVGLLAIVVLVTYAASAIRGRN